MQDCDAGSGNLDTKKKKKRKKKTKEGNEQKIEVVKKVGRVEDPETAKNKASRDRASSSQAETGGTTLQAHSHTVEGMDDAGMWGFRPKAQAAVPHLKALEAQTANSGAETAAQTSPELTLQTWARISGGSPTHSVASQAQQAPSQSAPPPAAFQDAPNLQVSSVLQFH